MILDALLDWLAIISFVYVLTATDEPAPPNREGASAEMPNGYYAPPPPVSLFRYSRGSTRDAGSPRICGEPVVSETHGPACAGATPSLRSTRSDKAIG